MELTTEQTSYRSHPSFKISDHKPVSSEFTINVSQFQIILKSRISLHPCNSKLIVQFNAMYIQFQVYEDPTERTVEFTPMHTWQIGEENIVEYTLPNGFDEAGSDWIGIYKVFTLFILIQMLICYLSKLF